MDASRRDWMTTAASAVVGIGVLGSSRSVAAGSAAEACEHILARLHVDYLATIDPRRAESLLASQGTDGRWSDVDLTSTRNPDWPPLEHMNRLRLLAVAWAKQRHTLAGSAAALTGIERGLQAWLHAAPRSENWWFNSIGPQLALMPVLVLTRRQLNADLARRARSLLVAPDEVPRAQARGQNLIWYGTQWLVRGALVGSTEEVEAASRRMQAELNIGGAEGIQHDNSFHQHGPQLYSGTYGLRFLLDSSQVASWLQGTPWAYREEGLRTLTDYALQGVRPLVRGPWLDWGARGREFTRLQRESRPSVLRPAIERMAALVPAQQRELAEFAAYLGRADDAPPAAPVVENRHFWRSDFMVHQRPAVYYSVKATSSRTVGTESAHGENLLGYWSPLGCSFVLRRGDEYDGLPPVWDWSRLPGTTAPATVPHFEGLLRHNQRFVGGVSDAGNGLMAMQLNTPQVRARKAWFFYGDVMVALGCDIQSSSAELVATTLNQARIRGRVVAGTKVLSDGMEAKAQGCWHDGFHYASLDGQELSVRRSRRSGVGQRINRALGAGAVEAEVALITIEHGRQPSASRYAYAVGPGDEDRPQVSKPAKFVNASGMQCVWWYDGGPLMAVFHEPGSVALDERTRLTTNAACLVMVRRLGMVWRTHVSEPTGTLRELVLTVEQGTQSPRRMTVTLPTERGQAGRTVVCEDVPAF